MTCSVGYEILDVHQSLVGNGFVVEDVCLRVVARVAVEGAVHSQRLAHVPLRIGGSVLHLLVRAHLLSRSHGDHLGTIHRLLQLADDLLDLCVGSRAVDDLPPSNTVLRNYALTKNATLNSLSSNGRTQTPRIPCSSCSVLSPIGRSPGIAHTALERSLSVRSNENEFHIPI